MDSSSSNTEFRDKLIKLALPRLIVDAFGMGVDIELLKYYGHYISNLDQLDEMLKTDEKGRSRAGDLALKTDCFPQTMIKIKVVNFGLINIVLYCIVE